MKSLRSYFYRAQRLIGVMNQVQMNNLLEHAAREGQTRTAEALIEAGANVHADEDEPLRIAAWCGRSETVKAILEAGADVHARHDQALQWAVDGELAGGDDKHKQTQKILKDWITAHPQ
jgi:ankyrin repeat protein